MSLLDGADFPAPDLFAPSTGAAQAGVEPWGVEDVVAFPPCESITCPLRAELDQNEVARLTAEFEAQVEADARRERTIQDAIYGIHCCDESEAA